MAEPSSETITQKPRIPMLKHAPQTTEETRRSLKWRVVDIAVGAAVGVMSGVMFWVFDGMSYGLFPLLTLILPGSAALLHALFYFPATLGLLIVRKPGVGLRAVSRLVRGSGARHEIQCESGSDRARAGARRRNGVRTVPLPPLDAWRHIAVIRGDRHRIQLLPVVLLLPSILILQSTRAHRYGVRVVERVGVCRLWLMGPVSRLVAIRRPGSLRLWTLIHAQGGIYFVIGRCTGMQARRGSAVR